MKPKSDIRDQHGFRPKSLKVHNAELDGMALYTPHFSLMVVCIKDNLDNPFFFTFMVIYFKIGHTSTSIMAKHGKGIALETVGLFCILNQLKVPIMLGTHVADYKSINTKMDLALLGTHH